MRITTEAAQNFTFSRRTIALGAMQGGVALLLGGRMLWLSVFENERYRLLSESNRVNDTLIPPRRGWIIDRHGVPIANNRTDFRVDIIPDRVEDEARILSQLHQILQLNDEDMDRIRRELDRASGFRPVQVAENLDWEHYAAVSVRQAGLPGVETTRGFARNYPLGAAVGHLVGYVGAATSEQYQEENRNRLLVTPGFKLGKDGLEKTLERRLRGAPGAKRVEVTARGRLVRELATRPDRPGQNVRLTIDAGVQEYAARRMADNSGSLVMMDVETGDILAFVSMPAYDPNSFSDGISRSEWKMLSEDDHIPLMNKILQGLYPPGSTVKPMHGLALLRAGVDPHRRVNCAGVLQVGNGRFHCHKRGGHGPLDMRGAIAQSCDIYFYQLARELGYDAFAPTVRDLGLGAEYDLPYPSQRYGTVPDSAWKQRKYNESWTVADSLNASIGQGYVLANPLQLAIMASRIAGGRRVVPRLLLDTPHNPAPPMDISDEHLAIIRDAMWAVVNDGGTGGYSARLPVEGMQISGKTGTAQVRRITAAERARGVLSNAALPFRLRDHSLYVCFAPSDRPKYAMSVVLEHHGHTNALTDAKVVARDVMTYMFDRQKAMATLEELEPSWGGDYRTRMAAQEAAFRAAEAAAAGRPAPVPTASPSPGPTPTANATARPTPSPAPTPARAPVQAPRANAPSAQEDPDE